MLFSVALLSIGINYQFNYVYFTIGLDIICLALSVNSLPFLLYSALSLAANFKLLNRLWSPESSTALFFVFSLSIYEIALMIQTVISKTLSNFINNTTHDRKFSEQVAHDIRSPLGVLKMLIEQVDWKSNQEEIKSTVYSSLNRISAISKTLTENKTLAKQPHCDLTPLVEAIKTVEKEFDRESFITLTTDRVANDYRILIDEIELYRVMQNLFKNAMQVVNVTQILVEVTESKNNIKISVSNDGKIPTDAMVKSLIKNGGSFNKIDGSGIGLNYCKSAINKANGTFDLIKNGRHIVVTINIRTDLRNS